MDAAELSSALAEGQAVWYAPGKGGGCVNCHSPDGIEFAWVGYSDCDLRRRALTHVTEEQADKLVTYVHALRQTHQIERPLHPDHFRPFQPAHEPLGEVATDLDVVDTKKQDQRDELFMNELVEGKKLLFATQTVDSLEKAHLAYDELLAMDLESLRLGIPFDRLSEDPHAADSVCATVKEPAHLGKSIFEWFPAIPVAPKPGSEQAWNALRDAYVQEPTTERLWAYYDKIDDLLRCDLDLSKDSDPDYYGRACEWMTLKYKSLQIVQHMLRQKSAKHPDTLVEFHAPGAPPPFAGEHLDTVLRRSPIWETGDFIRRNPLARKGDPACFSSPAHPCTFLPPAIDETIHSIPSYEEARINQGDLFRLSWVMMGFLREPTLTQHSEQFATFIGDYLESVLLPRYDVHHAFVFTQMAVRKSAAKEWFDAPGFRKGTGKIASVRTFSFKQIRDNFSPPLENSPRYATHRKMFANFARMFLYLIEEDIRLSGEVFGLNGRSKEEGGLLVATRFMRSWIAELEGKEDPAINALQLSIEAQGPKAKELRDEQNMKDYNGLEPTFVWSEFQAPYGG